MDKKREKCGGTEEQNFNIFKKLNMLWLHGQIMNDEQSLNHSKRITQWFCETFNQLINDQH